MTEKEEPKAVSFEDLGLSPEVMKSVVELGYEAPTPIQQATIGLLMKGRDVIGQAQTGTGKTAAFAIPIIERLDPDLTDERGKAKVQGLVLAPTRELAVQVAEATHRLGRHKGVTVLPIYGGQPIDRQLRALRSGVQIVVGTPGRVMDHMRRGTLDLSSVRVLVLDEADEMLDMGFVEDIEWILEEMPSERQTALFSATIPPRIRALSKKYLKDPEIIQISSPGKLTVPQTEQCYVEVHGRGKLDALSRILDHEDPEAVLVFARTKRDVDELGEALLGRGYPSETLHGDLTQAQRDRVMKRFREGNLEVLVATDVAARGLDVESVTHVINYDLPDDPGAYVHRIGRTGRAGRKGVAISFVTPRDRRLWSIIQRVVGKHIPPMRLPTAADIQARRLDILKDQVREAIRDGQLDNYLNLVGELEEEFDPGEIAAGFAKIATEATQPRSMVGSIVGASPVADAARPETGMARLYIGAGRNTGLRPADVVGAIANETGLPGKAIGAIDIFPTYTFVEVPAERAPDIVRILSSSTIKGNRVRVDVASPDMIEEPPARAERPPRPIRREPEPRPVPRPQETPTPRDPDPSIDGDRPRDAEASVEDEPVPAAPVRRAPPSWEREQRGEAPPRRTPTRAGFEEPDARRAAAPPPWLKRRG